RLRYKQLESDQRQRLIEAADDGADIEPCGGCANKQCRIDWRIIQRKPLEHPLKIKAVVNFEETVSDRVPVGEKLVVARDAEVQSLPDARQDLRPIRRRA